MHNKDIKPGALMPPEPEIKVNRIKMQHIELPFPPSYNVGEMVVF